MEMRASVTGPRKTTAIADRIAWDDIKDRIDLAAIATALFGPAPKRSGRRLLWPCPFHDDHDPSLQVDPAERRWKCWPCDLGGGRARAGDETPGGGVPRVRAARRRAGRHRRAVEPARPPEVTGRIRPGPTLDAGRRRPAREGPRRPARPARRVGPAGSRASGCGRL